MPTLTDMIDEVQGHLRSQVRDQEMSTHLTAGIDASVTSLTVADGDVISRGRIQIDNELLWVDEVNRTTGVVTIAPYGRGMDNSTAATHSTGARVIMQPLFPNVEVKNKINQTIAAIGGHLYGVATVQVPVTPLGNVYELPADTRKVVSVSREYTTGSDYDVEYLRRWKFDPNAQASIVATGKAVYIYDPVSVPYSLNITYLKDPLPLADGADFSTSLLPASAYDVVILGAASRMMMSAAAYQSSTRSVEANALDGRGGVDAVMQQSRLLQVMFQQRLEEEKMKFFNLFANRTHYTG